MPIGPWPKDPELKEIGMMNLVQLLDGLDVSLKALMAFGYTEAEVTLMLARARKELKSREFHSYIKLYVSEPYLVHALRRMNHRLTGLQLAMLYMGRNH